MKTQSWAKDLRNAVKFLREEPTRFEMTSWMLREADFSYPTWWVNYLDKQNLGKAPQCGTVCCLSGAMHLINPGKYPTPSSASDSEELSQKIFYLGDWPDSAKELYFKAKNHTQRIDALVLAIKLIIGIDAEPKVKS